MMNKRKWAVIAGAMLFASIGLYGCNNDDANAGRNNDKCKADPSLPECQGTQSEDCKANPDQLKCKEIKADCKDPAVCATAEECQDSDGKLACSCVTNMDVCHANKACNGVSEACTFTCGAEGTCEYAACSGSAACLSNCTLEFADSHRNDDTDGDGMTNGEEINCRAMSREYDPCKPDTDGDGILDGIEDLNHNCQVDSEFGESDPLDATDPSGMNNKEVMARSKVCDLNTMRGSSKVVGPIAYVMTDAIARKGSVAGIGALELVGSGGNVAAFDLKNDSGSGNAIAGMFFGQQGLPMPLDMLLANLANANIVYVADSSFTANVPAASWASNVYDHDNLQIVPDHEVERYKYTITAEGKSLEEVRELLVNGTGDSVSISSAKSTVCADGKMTMYIAFSHGFIGTEVQDLSIYSIGLACASDMEDTSAGTNLRMDDIISGTLVTHSKLRVDKRFICQSEAYNASTGAVDFLWVVDNSGSMSDELDNVAKTADQFLAKLNNSGMDYRLAVTTTDAYLIDEFPGAYEVASKLDDRKSESYFEPTGCINGAIAPVNNAAMKHDRCTLDKQYAGLKASYQNSQRPGYENASFFPAKLALRNTCRAANDPDLNYANICGYGTEDGLKSGLLVLQRLAVDAANIMTDSEKGDDVYALKKSWLCGSNDPEETCNQNMANKCVLRSGALKYIIFVSDEESRQFKEDPYVGGTQPSRGGYTPESNNIPINVCKSGYKLESDAGNASADIGKENYSMDNGPIGDKAAGCTEGVACSICNDSKNTKTKQLMQADGFNERTSLEDLKANYPDYYNMLMYYVLEYRKAAGDNIAAFALVGDKGKAQGAYCKPLGMCPRGNTCKRDGTTLVVTSDKEGGCDECVNEAGEEAFNFGDSQTRLGADYGLSYIHFARFLSKLNDTGNNGNEGGYGSVCNTSYENTVDAIFKDVLGRVSAHSLKGYPVSSSIRVAITKLDGTAVELERGATTMGWDYDASQNAIVFNGIDPSVVGDDDYIAIAYNLWESIAI